MVKVGYARVSTEEQNLDLQMQALKAAGCEDIYCEKVSGAAKRRPQLDLALKALQEGDVLVVWRLDRLARSMRQLLVRLDQIVEAGAKLKSLTEEIDISTAVGRLMLTFLGGFAEFERSLTVERTNAGIAAAKARGVRFGRKPKFTEAKRKRALKLWKSKKYTNKEIARRIGISPTLFQNFLRDRRARKI